MVLGIDLDVGKNNQPSHENIPASLSNTNRIFQEKNDAHEDLGWDWSGIDNGKCLNIQDQNPTLRGFVG